MAGLAPSVAPRGSHGGQAFRETTNAEQLHRERWCHGSQSANEGSCAESAMPIDSVCVFLRDQRGGHPAERLCAWPWPAVGRADGSRPLTGLKELEALDFTDAHGLQVEAALLYHSLNLFADCMDHVLMGRFDTLLYLLRPMFDLGALIMVTRRSDDLAKQLLGDEFKASDARKTVVQLLREAGFEEEAEKLDRDWAATSKTIQFASHVTAENLFGLLQHRDGVAVAIAGGKPDGKEALAKGRMVIAGEMRTLSYFRSNHPDDLSPGTLAEFDSLERETKAWLAESD